MSSAFLKTEQGEPAALMTVTAIEVAVKLRCAAVLHHSVNIFFLLLLALLGQYMNVPLTAHPNGGSEAPVAGDLLIYRHVPSLLHFSSSSCPFLCLSGLPQANALATLQWYYLSLRDLFVVTFNFSRPGSFCHCGVRRRLARARRGAKSRK